MRFYFSFTDSINRRILIANFWKKTH